MTLAAELVDAYRDRSRATPGLYALATHAALAAAVNAELLHHLRDNFLLGQLPVTPAVEAGMAQLLLSPLFREVGDGLWEMQPDVRSLLLAELAALDGGQRVQDVAALLERYTREESPWQDWPELREAQLFTAWAQLDPQAADQWLDAGSTHGSATGVDAAWFVAMRRKVDESRRPVAASRELAVSAVIDRYRDTQVAFGAMLGTRLTESGMAAIPMPVLPVGSVMGLQSSAGYARGLVVGADAARGLAFLAEGRIAPRRAAPLAVAPTDGAPATVHLLGRTAIGVTLTAGRLAGIDEPGHGELVVDLTTGGALGLAVDDRLLPSGLIIDALADKLGDVFVGAAQLPGLDEFVDLDTWYSSGAALLAEHGRFAAAARVAFMRAAALGSDAPAAERSAALTEAATLLNQVVNARQHRDVMAAIALDPGGRAWLENLATDIPPDVIALAEEYERTRESQHPGEERTAAMDAIVARMRGTARSHLLPQLTSSPSPGLRLAAIVELQDRPDPAWVEWLGGRLEAERPFVGYQAAVAMRNAAEFLPARQLPALQEALTTAELAMAAQPGTDRAAMLRVTAQIMTDRRTRRRKTKTLPLDWKLWDAGQTVRIRFLDGTAEQRRRVERVAKEWLAQANLKFEFLPYPSTARSDVRITFKQPGSWSYAGATARAISDKEPTACIGPEFTTDAATFDYTIRRQFGHILGLVNEHQSPNAKIRWDTEAAYRTLTGPPNFWRREDVDRNLLQRYAIDGYRDFDPDSVMMWELAPELTGGQRLGGKRTLSRSDVEFVGRLYPRPAAADRPQRSGSQSYGSSTYGSTKSAGTYGSQSYGSSAYGSTPSARRPPPEPSS